MGSRGLRMSGATPKTSAPGDHYRPSWTVRLPLSAAAVIPVLLFGIFALFEWRAVWLETEQELARSADATAEYSLRVLEGHRLAAERVNDLLAGLSDDEIRARELELYQRLRDLLPSLPLVQTVAVSDRDGVMLVTANVFPVPRDQSFRDREWVRDLGQPDTRAPHISKVNIGRLDN